jgi:hypothetical protein
MTLSEAGEIFAYWTEKPPVHLMAQTIARMLGWKPAAEPMPRLDDIMAMAPAGLSVTAACDIGMPPPVLDIETLRARNRAHLANRAHRRAVLADQDLL